MAERKKIIVLDPAHGGTEDRGGSSWQGGASAGPGSIAEKDVSLALARAVKLRLDPTHDVRLTRDRDVNLSLSERATMARDLGADMFLSIHFNAAADPAVDGTETWVANHASDASQAFAESIPRRVAHAAGIENRGLRHADFGVLLPSRHDPHTAACLVEVAFLTNPGEAARLRNATYLGQLADALSDAVRAPAGIVSAQAAPVPVIEMTRAEFRGETAEFVRGPSGFDAILRGQFSAPETVIAIYGGLMMEAGGKRREITPAELKKLAPRRADSAVYSGGAVTSGKGDSVAVGADGCFRLTGTAGMRTSTPRIHVKVTVELKDGTALTADGVFRRRDLDGFLQLVDFYEKQRPIGRKDGVCVMAAGHFDFVTAVRKMFQPAPGSPLTPLFDQVLFRNHKVCRLLDVNSADAWDLRRFEDCQIGKDIADIGHVLVLIEAHRRQKPDSQLLSGVSSDPVQPEAFLGWAGDLGSALVPFAQSVVAARYPGSAPAPPAPVRRPCTVPPPAAKKDLQWFLAQKAGSSDLLGDIDGINIGAIYDDSKSLSDNLRAYYGAKPFRRFHNFLANALDSAGAALFSLKGSRLDPAGRLRAGSWIQSFCWGVVKKRKLTDGMSNTDETDFLKMLTVGSREMDEVIKYFFDFIERGLAKE